MMKCVLALCRYREHIVLRAEQSSVSKTETSFGQMKLSVSVYMLWKGLTRPLNWDGYMLFLTVKRDRNIGLNRDGMWQIAAFRLAL